MPKITILDGYVANPGDISWDAIIQHGVTTIYDRTLPNEVFNRAKGANILVVNKVILDEGLISRLHPTLQCICTLATGYNNIDIAAAQRLGITVCNAPGYGPEAVAQHVFALLLELTNRVALHNQSVQNNEWAKSPDWCYWKQPLISLSGKTMGVLGTGEIGRRVIRIAQGFGMKIIAKRKNRYRTPVPLVDLPTLFGKSDVLSLNAPLNHETKEIVNRRTLSMMKPTAFLINTSRGGLINEADLRFALEHGQIAGAGLDVLSEEPPPENHPLLGLPNCIITPHQAWAAQDARKRLIQIVGENIGAFLEGKPRNVVNQ